MKNLLERLTSINNYAIPVLEWSFGVIKWTEKELEIINRTIRTYLTKYRLHHPKSSVERDTLQKDLGGRGITDVKDAQIQQIRILS